MFVGFKQQLRGLVFIFKNLMMKSLKPMFRGNITKDLRNGSHVIIKKGYVRVVGVGEGSKN